MEERERKREEKGECIGKGKDGKENCTETEIGERQRLRD